MRSREYGSIRRIASAVAPATTDRYGVRKPVVRHIDISNEPAKIKGAEDTPNRFPTLIRKIAATEILKSSKAIPGAP